MSFYGKDYTCPHGEQDGVCCTYNASLYDGCWVPLHKATALSQDKKFDLDFDNVEETDNGPPSTWRPVDLTAVLDGTWEPPQPTVGIRNDKVGVLYPGKLHTASGESESGKSWLAVIIAVAELNAGNSVCYIDFEDDEGGVGNRLLAAGANTNAVRERFAYLRPEEPILTGKNAQDLNDLLGDLRPTFTVLDGVTEAMSLHGLDPISNTDIARFRRILLRPIASRGPAVLALDHVTKDSETRGRYALGGVHKLNGVDGAAYIVENREPFGIGRTGKSTVRIAKDRPGQLRRHGLPGRAGMFWFADIVVDSQDVMFVEAELTAPPPEQDDRTFRPTAVMRAVCAALAGNSQGLNTRALRAAVRGKNDIKDLAVNLLLNEGYVARERCGQATVYKLLKSFEEQAA